MYRLRQFGLLIWKNWLLQKRKVVLTCFEIGVPVIFALILLLIRQLVDSEKIDTLTTWPSVPVRDALPDRLVPPVENVSNWALAYSPDGEHDRRLMERVGARLNMRTEGYGFDSEEEMAEHIKSLGVGTLDILAGVHFSTPITPPLPSNIRYKIRPRAEQYNSGNTGSIRFLTASDWYTSIFYPFFTSVGPRQPSANDGGRPGYFSEGFLSLQRAVDLAIIEEINSTADVDSVDMHIKRHPYPPYVLDRFVNILQFQFPLIIMLSFVVVAPNMCKDIVLEKERKLRESMKLMGLVSSLNWLAWFVKYLIFLVISIFFMTLFFHLNFGKGAIINYTHPTITFVFLLLYGVATMMFCFAISTFFSKANAGAAAGGILFLATYIPYFFINRRLEELSASAKIGISIVPNLAMGLGCVELSLTEGFGVGLSWSTLNVPVNADHNFTMLHVMLLLLLDAVIFGIITWYFDAVFPGDFGIPKPLYFMFTRSYWCGPKKSTVGDETVGALDYSTLSGINSEYFEKAPGITPGIKIRQLRKDFKKNKQKKVAVKDMNIDMYEGQITSLLGHNGAGKTTTMFMLSGFLPPTSGTAYINDHSITQDIEAIRKNLGLCPQHDILFDTMTVKEHLIFFAKLKGCPSSQVKTAVNDMIEVLHLEEKRHVFAKNLSGGMKRKLSVGIALIAGSKIVILDEPTSGMDPEARRQTWDILQSQRAGRTMILSTHFMEEADLLGDRIAIMADGVIQCYGSSLFLKSKYGVGYHMVMVKQPGCDVDRIRNIITQHVPNARLESNISAELSFVLPHESKSEFEALFTTLEANKDELKIFSFGASVTTMEEVFLRVGEAADESLETALRTGVQNDLHHAALTNEKGHSNKAFLAENGSNDVQLQKAVFHSHTAPSYGMNDEGSQQSDSEPHKTSGATHVALDITEALDTSHENTSEQKANGLPTRALSVEDDLPPVFGVANEKNKGNALIWQQFRAMMMKHMIHTWRNKIIGLVQLLVPLFFTLIGCIVLNTFPGPRDPPPLDLVLNNWDRTVSPFLSKNLPDNGLAQKLATAFAGYTSRISVVENITENITMDKYLGNVARESFDSFNSEYMAAASFEDKTSEDNYTVVATGHFNNIAYHVNAIVMSLLGNTLLQYFTGNEDYTITATNHPLPRTTDTVIQDELATLTATGFTISWCISFGMAFLVGTFVVYAIRERQTKSKHIQFVSGVNVGNYWFSTFLWHFFCYLIPTLLMLALFAGFRVTAYVGGSNAGYMILLFIFYAWAVLPFVYLLSFLFSVPATGYVWITVINIFTGTAAILAVVILQFPGLDTEDVGEALEWVFFIILPNFCFGNGIENLYSNHESIRICSQIDEIVDRDIFCFMLKTINFTNPCCPDNCGSNCAIFDENYLAWNSPGLGRPLIFMVLQGFLFFAILFLVESRVGRNCWQRATVGDQSEQEEESDVINMADMDDPMLPNDEDVLAESKRISEADHKALMASESLVLRDLRKYYGSLLAVDRLSVGIPQGECFGLLGVNGAGKTTTFKMMTGDETVSSGDAFLGGYSVKSDIKKVQQLLGYCPQFDALIDQMTVTETLWMYARLRGIVEDDIEEVVNTLIKQLLLEEHANKEAGQLSGGNKRKLSSAIALVGDPPVVFLDEPTTGMDPLARRLLWDTLTKVRQSGRTLVLTSHSMEECEALCTRLAIMVNGKFRCLGSTQHLKNKFGEGYTLIAKVLSPKNDAVDTLDSRTTELRAFIENTFPGSILKDIHYGLLHYHVSSANHTWAKVFGTMERAKEQYHIEDYSVSQTTLEQVFINFARAQIPPREEGMTCGTKCCNCCAFMWCCKC